MLFHKVLSLTRPKDMHTVTKKPYIPVIGQLSSFIAAYCARALACGCRARALFSDRCHQRIFHFGFDLCAQ